AAAEIKKRRRAPAICDPPADHAATTAPAYNETAFQDAGENCNRLSAIEQLTRNRFLARIHDLIKDARGFRGLIGGGAHFLCTARARRLGKRRARRATEKSNYADR